MANIFIKATYKIMRPPGHPIHLRHIKRGSFSQVDRKTLKFHLKNHEEKLTKEEIEHLHNIISKEECETDSEREAISKLQSIIDHNEVYMVPGVPRFLFYAPLLAGFLAIIVFAIAAFINIKIPVFENRTTTTELKTRIYVMEERITALTDTIGMGVGPR